MLTFLIFGKLASTPSAWKLEAERCWYGDLR